LGGGDEMEQNSEHWKNMRHL